jgi:hypothetical protein
MVACMAVMARETWTDERLDDLNARVQKGFDEVKSEVKDLRQETNEGFARVDARFQGIDARFQGLDARFDALQRTMIVCAAGVIGSIAASVVGTLIVTQL